MAVTRKSRHVVYDRDDHTCVVAGSNVALKWPCAGPPTVQHAVGRGMGGSARYDGVEYLRTMCAWHNTLFEQNPFAATWARWYGWSVPRNRVDIDILTVPVLYPDGLSYALDEAGGKTLVPFRAAWNRRRDMYGEQPEM